MRGNSKKKNKEKKENNKEDRKEVGLPAAPANRPLKLDEWRCYDDEATHKHLWNDGTRPGSVA